MKLKLDENGKPVFGANKLPIYVNDDGSDYGEFDAASAVGTIKRVNAESAERRRRIDELEQSVKAFEGLDPTKARDALETVSKLDQKKLIDAGQVDVVRAEVNKVWEGKFGDLQKERDSLVQTLHNEKIGGSFGRSKFVTEKLAIPVDIAQQFFGPRFKLENGEVRGYDTNGNPLYSRTKPGEPASFDEALEILVDSYPHKDSILKSKQGSGSGAPQGGSGPSGKKSLSREAFTKLSPADQMAHTKSGGVIDG